VDKTKATPLHHACSAGLQDVVAVLAKKQGLVGGGVGIRELGRIIPLVKCHEHASALALLLYDLLMWRLAGCD